MKWLRRSIGALALLIVAVVVLPPLLGSLLGLDSYRYATPAAGDLIALPSGQHLNVVTEGGGPPVVLIHGLPGGTVQMAPLAEQLAARGLKTLRIDRMGWGHSSARAGEPYTLEQNARDVIALLDALHIDRADLIGYSFGGGVIQEVARLAPERIHAAVLVASIGPARKVAPPGAVQQMLFSTPVLNWMLSTRATAMAAAGNSFTALFLPDVPSTPDIDAQLATLALGDSVNTWVHESAEARMTYAALEPQRLQCPVLILQGVGDQVVKLEVAEQLSNAIPGSQLKTFNGTVHGMVMTRAPMLADAIAEFLERQRVAAQ